MIDLGSGRTTAAADLRCSRALIERFTPEPVETPAAMSARAWVELAASRLTATQACAVVEHRFGVLPLIALFDHSDERIDEIASGSKLGALGLFTPSPERGWGAVPLAGEWTAGALRVSGEVRLSSSAIEGAIVLVRVSDAENRLAWLDLHIDGVERRASRSGELLGQGDSPCWLLLDGATIEAALVSRPVTPGPGTELHHTLEAYASVWALAAVHICRRIVLALRHAARSTRSPGDLAPLRDSQLVAMGITEIEIESELAAAAVRRGMSLPDPANPAGLVLALSAARALTSATETARQLHDQLGLPLDGWLVDATAPGLTTYLGGTLMLENELARALGLCQSSAAEAL